MRLQPVMKRNLCMLLARSPLLPDLCTRIDRSDSELNPIHGTEIIDEIRNISF